jgi:hypothetical protein
MEWAVVTICLAVLAFLVVGGICWVLYRLLRKRISQRAAFLFLGGLSLLIASVIYTALYPRHEFYEEKYQQITLLPFPKTGQIIAQDASYPDLPQGHYQACALIEVSPEEYQQIQTHLAHDTIFEVVPCILDSFYYHSPSFKKVTAAIPCAHYAHSYAQKGSFIFRYVGLLTDGKSIVIYRFSI